MTTETHVEVIATSMREAGFTAQILGQSDVLVKLSSRGIGQVEVEIALEQLFNEIKFDLKRSREGVVVTHCN